MLWWIVAPDTISAHDVSVKILRRFRAEHSCPHHKIFKKRRAVCRLAFGFPSPPCFRFCEASCCRLLFEENYICCTPNENHIGQALKPGGEAAAAVVWDFRCANMQFGYITWLIYHKHALIRTIQDEPALNNSSLKTKGNLKETSWSWMEQHKEHDDSERNTTAHYFERFWG
jgi:hypothetical protein